MIFNEEQVRKTIALMKPNNELFEVRVIAESKKVLSGYFTSADTLIDALSLQQTDLCNVYMTLNAINQACYGRSQRDRLEYNSKATTSDNDIVGYEWLMVDLDPKRPSGTSSSEEELQKAKDLGNRIYGFMAQIGFERPLMAFSGNGVHLMYRIRLANNDENKKLVEKCLKTLNMLFDDDYIGVDMKNFNPARVCKLYGTIAQKGSNTSDRPHRISYVIGKSEEIKITDKSYLEKLCELYPKDLDKPKSYNNYSPSEFNLENWLSKFNIRYTPSTFADGAKYILECCPFDSNHKGKDACIFQAKSGAISFKCLHNSCSDKRWQDVRLMYEPDAYEKKQLAQEQTMYKSFNRDKAIKHIEPIANKPIFLSALDILNMPKEEEHFIKTGIGIIDQKLRGLKKGYVSVWSGLRGSSKSTVLSQTMLNAVNNGNNVGCYSGELQPRNFMRWMNLQAAGKGNVEPSQYEGYYNVPFDTQRDIAEWLNGHFWLYNNEYGNDYVAMKEQFEQVIVDKKLDMLILDNLMSFDISSLADSKYEAQTAFIWSLQRDLAKKYNCHIAFVAHPRKALGFLRLDDISGTADLANAVDNAFIVHRNNNDFKRLSAQMFGWKPEDYIYQGTNVVEIAKDRDGGHIDEFIPLYYEVESKRLKNYISENVIYGWDKKEEGYDFCNVADEETPFD